MKNIELSSYILYMFMPLLFLLSWAVRQTKNAVGGIETEVVKAEKEFKRKHFERITAIKKTFSIFKQLINKELNDFFIVSATHPIRGHPVWYYRRIACRESTAKDFPDIVMSIL